MTTFRRPEVSGHRLRPDAAEAELADVVADAAREKDGDLRVAAQRRNKPLKHGIPRSRCLLEALRVVQRRTPTSISGTIDHGHGAVAPFQWLSMCRCRRH